METTSLAPKDNMFSPWFQSWKDWQPSSRTNWLEMTVDPLIFLIGQCKKQIQTNLKKDILNESDMLEESEGAYDFDDVKW